MGDIIARLDSLKQLVQDLLVFARPREPRTEPVDLVTCCDDTIDLVRRDPVLAGSTSPSPARRRHMPTPSSCSSCCQNIR